MQVPVSIPYRTKQVHPPVPHDALVFNRNNRLPQHRPKLRIPQHHAALQPKQPKRPSMDSHRFSATAHHNELRSAALFFSRARAFESCSSTVTLGFAGVVFSVGVASSSTAGGCSTFEATSTPGVTPSACSFFPEGDSYF